MLASLVLVLAFVQLCAAASFQAGFDHHYVYKATSDFLGMHNVTTIIKFHVQHQNRTTAGEALNALWLDNFVQFTQAGQFADNPMNWNLSRPFLFSMSPEGIVLQVHVHPEDETQVVTIKKVLSSTFSANIKIRTGSNWTYSSEDSDHHGTLSHDYTVTRKDDGIQLRRYHRSVKHVERIHDKTLSIDNFGTVHAVTGEDNIVLEDRLNSDFETKRKPYPEEYVIESSVEGAVGTIKARSDISTRLTHKRRSTGIPRLHHGLTPDGLLLQQETTELKTLESVQEDINNGIACVHRYEDKSDTNRTVCVNKLREKILSLNLNDYVRLAKMYLTKTCGPNDTRCEDERLLFVDIVARAGDELSQNLTVQHVLQAAVLDEEAARRALIHIAVLDKPVQETILAVENLCFGDNDQHHGSINMTNTIRRACLTLGAIAKVVNKYGNDTEANCLMDKIHSWLYRQGDETPAHLRPRRSVMDVNSTVTSTHLLSKFVLLHALGNAGLNGSLGYLREYATPNTRVPAWRRAALYALRYYTCTESADILLNSLTNDEVETVRATAMEHFLKHPLQKNVSREMANALLSKSYTYPTVLRLRRSNDLDQILLEFKVELPSVHWGYTVGNSAVGASFGVDMVNKMHLRLKALSGFFHINVWDRIYAEAHVGILGIRVDILHIEACYRGKIEYNLNILKDFSYGSEQKDFDEYDAAAGAIVGPMVSATKGIAGHFHTASGDPQSVFKPLSDAVKNIPAQARSLLDAAISLMSLLDHYQGLPLLSKAKQLAFKLQSLAEDIKGDALNFYNELADTALIALPHAETQIQEASNMIIEAKKKLGSNPKQAFETINVAKYRIYTATYQIIKAKSAIQEALSPHGGSLPTWISSQEEIKIVTAALQSIHTELTAKIKLFRGFPEESQADLIDWNGLINIQRSIEKALSELQKLARGSQPFHAIATETMKKTQDVKLSVDDLDKKTKETQQNVRKSFGPKFNKKFPAQRREPDERCGKGIWPSRTGGRYNDTPGIDVIVEELSEVVCPINGLVSRTCEADEIRITPSDDDFKMYTILISNIRPTESIPPEGQVFKAGQSIGRGKGKSGCSDPYIHVAMREQSGQGKESCNYVDPSSFVDNIQPFPKWQEECKEFIFKHIGNVLEAGLSGLGFEEIIEELAKRAMAWVGAEMVQKVVSKFPKSPMAKMAGTMAFAYLSTHNSEIANAFMKQESQSSLMEEKCDEMKKQRDNPKPSPAPNMTANANVGKKDVQDMIQVLQGNKTSLDKSVSEIQSVIDKLQESSSGLKLDEMTSVAFNKFGKILNKLGIPSKGSKQSMETTLQMLSWKVCPTFENGVAQGYGHMCIPSNDCLGLNCTLRISQGIRKDKINLAVAFDLQTMTFIILSSGRNYSVIIDGSYRSWDGSVVLDGYFTTFVSHTNHLNTSVGNVYQLTLSAVVCDHSARCLPDVHIFHNLTFLKHQMRHIRSAEGGCTLKANVDVDKVGHIGGSLDIAKDGHVSAGGLDVGAHVGDADINAGFHANDKGQWGTNVGTDFDLGDGNTVGGGFSLEGDGDKLSYGADVHAKFGDSGSVGGFVRGNSDGDITAGIDGSVKVGTTNISAGAWVSHDKNGTSGGGSMSANFNGKGQIGASLNGSSDGSIDFGVGGSGKIGNTTVSGAGYLHHDKNGTSGGGIVSANFNGKGSISASLNGSSDGTIDAGISGSGKIGNSTVGGAAYLHHDKNGTSGGGVVSANVNGKGSISASLNGSSDGTIDAGISGSGKIGNSTVGGAAYLHHDKNGTSGGGVVSANVNGKGSISASLNGSSDGTIDAGISGSGKIGNSTVGGAAYLHHDNNGTSGGGVLSANINGKGSISASVNGSSDGTIDAGIAGSGKIGNSTLGGAAYLHHDKNGTSGGGVVAANINGKGSISASVNASSDGTVDAEVAGSAQIGNSTIGGAAYLHHDNNGTSGGGVVAANINGKGSISASVNGSSDGTVDAGVAGSAQIGNSTVGGATYLHHDKNGTSGGGVVAANINGKGSISASVNASSDGTVDAGVAGAAQIGNSTVVGAAYLHHDNNGTSGGGVVAANINGKGSISASVNGSSDGTVDAGVAGSAQIGNSTIGGAAYLHHDNNGTSGSGVVAANINGKGSISASVNGSSDGTVDAGVAGSAQIGNSTVGGAAYLHHDKNGTSGGGVVAANINGKGSISASVNASSDGTVDAGVAGAAQIGNSTVVGAAYLHHDNNGTSGGGVVAANINGKGSISASVNGSSDGTVDAGVAGSAQIGNSTIGGAAYLHHDKNGTSGGGVVAANINGKGSISASVNGSSDGTVDAGVAGSAHIGNSTVGGAAYLHHDNNGTSGGGVVAANINGKGSISASVNGSSDGTVDAGVAGSAHIGNSTIGGAAYLHHDNNGTSGGGVVASNINGKGSISASVNGSSDGTVDAGVAGSAQIGNSTIGGAAYLHHDNNGTSGGGVVAAKINGKGSISASVNGSSDGTVDSGVAGSAHIGNSSVGGAAYLHHDNNGTSGGGVVAANINGKGSISASVNASSDGTVDAGVAGAAQIGNSTVGGAAYLHHDNNGTSGGGVVAANINGKGSISASVNASSDGTLDAGVAASAQIGNSTVGGAAYLHHGKNGTSGGGVVAANINGKGSISASVNASSDGTVDAGVAGSAQIGNSTVGGAAYLHHDNNGTSGGGVVAANINGKGSISASVNASSDGTVDAGVAGSAQIGNSTIGGAAYLHHDNNGTSSGGVVAANFNRKGSISASVNGSSDGTVDAGVAGSAQIGNSTIGGAAYLHHDQNGTSGGGVVAANINGKGSISASVNASSDGTVDAGVAGSAQIGNSTLGGAAYLHHDKNGTSGGGVVAANINGKGIISASVNGSSDGTVDAGVAGSAQIGNSTIGGAAYLHHDNNGTSSGGVVAANFNRKGSISASVNGSSDGTVDAGVAGSAQIGNSTVGGAAYLHQDNNGTSGGGVFAANINGKGSISASVNGSSDGTVDAGVAGSAHIGNSTVGGAAYLHQDNNGTSGGGVVAANINGKGSISASVNGSSDGTVYAGVAGSGQIGNSTFSGAGSLHHDKNGTSGAGGLSANINGEGIISAAASGSSGSGLTADLAGTGVVGGIVIAGHVHHDQNGTDGGIDNIGIMPFVGSDVSHSTESPAVELSTVRSTTAVPPADSGIPGHHVQSRSAEKCSVDLSTTIKDGNVNVGIGASIPGFGKVGAEVSFKDGQLVGDISIGDFSFDIGDMKAMTMDTFQQLSADFNIGSDTADVTSSFRDGIRSAVCTSEMEMSFSMETEFGEEDFPARDKKDGVTYKDKHVDITIFELSYTFGVGPIGIGLSFGAGGAIGSSMWSDIHANKGKAAFSIGPWVAGMIWGGIKVELGIASGGLKLTGYILQTKFPITMETQSAKHPLVVVMNIDLELIPIELSLRAWVKVFFIKVFDKCLWKWASKPFKWNILHKEMINKDKEPPRFAKGSFCGDYRVRRAAQECAVRQIPSRHPTDTAYQLTVHASDDDSAVTTSYAIGDYKGGTNVQNWVKFKGANQVVPAKLPNGIPLYFTVKASNAQGLEAFLHCHLDTYDDSPPNGRVEASHSFSSHPHIISSTVIVIDDSPINDTYKALGLSPGKYGREIRNWETFHLSQTTSRPGISTELKHFGVPRAGKLMTSPIKTLNARTPELCARECFQDDMCVSFDYEQVSETCGLQGVLASHDNQLHISGDYKNFERLGNGYTAFIQYNNIPLEHGAVYYVNTLIENSLHYQSFLFSEGTMIDFTPPETGYLGNATKDVTVSHRCSASVRQRCEQVTDLPNHRMVIDGPESRTVFSGNKPLHDERYTLTNHYVTANWDGFADPESGLWGFTWAVGRAVCGHDVVQFNDPHSHIASPKYWTFSGFHEGIHLNDGQYFVTVEALNSVVFGGALVTTVCHSIPFLVDTTPPVFHEITDVMFDEDFDILAAYYNVSDEQSSIARVDFGLGMTKHDVVVKAYSHHSFMERLDPYLVIENLELKPGIPAWVRLRAVNKVGLFATGHAVAPIMVDKTPPEVGTVMDGDILRVDLKYQHETDTICAQWIDFYDPESGIKLFIWGVGTLPELDDVVPFKNISRYEKRACGATTLKHNVTYFSTVFALNDALNSKRSNSSSDGVLVDTTPPIEGFVADRNSDAGNPGDIDFSSETSTVKASWNNFSDPESGIESFDVSIKINSATRKTLHIPHTDNAMSDHSLTLNHLDYVVVKVTANNGAKLSSANASDGFLVDHTPPTVNYIQDSRSGSRFQSDDSTLFLGWDFSDSESGIEEYRYQIFQILSGIKSKIVPAGEDFVTLKPGSSSKVSLELPHLSLIDGALYRAHVISLNRARLSSSHASEGVLVDVTPPIVEKIKLAMPKEEEELDDDDKFVLHSGENSLTVSWVARDSQSGIESIYVGVGTSKGDASASNDFQLVSSEVAFTTLEGLHLQYVSASSTVYYVSVKATNRAGLTSPLAYSKPIKVLKANVQGTVYDGRDDLVDTDFTRDETSLAVSFAGFESEACNIVGYEWAVGSEPYLTDVLPFTDYGVVLLNETYGHAQMHLELYESETYYATVRARTGEQCHEEFILSASNGITLDNKGPEISFDILTTVCTDGIGAYQQPTDSIGITWNVTDDAGLEVVAWRVGSLPFTSNVMNQTTAISNSIPPGSVTLSSGIAYFVTIEATDKAGINYERYSPALTVDTSEPLIHNYTCTKFLSEAKPFVGCEWRSLEELESSIKSVSFAIGTSPFGMQILNFTEVPVQQTSWNRDVSPFIADSATKSIYMALKVENAAGKTQVIESAAVVDRTAPEGGKVEFITQTSGDTHKEKRLCQTPLDYVEIRASGFSDKQSDIDRFEIGLGTNMGKVDVFQYKSFDSVDGVTIENLHLTPGTALFASVKIYNKANLYSTLFSDRIIVSPSPALHVTDGKTSDDEDYTSIPNQVQGHWHYSDACPVQEITWSVEDLTGNVLQDFISLPNFVNFFYNDELHTENGQTYVNIIKTIDALNRTRESRSDGLTVRIQPPKPGTVRDGLESDDINYQRQVSELSANWDDFGDPDNVNPTEKIVHYEVAVGNDRRYPTTRTNLHNFVNVGMNRSTTFTNLNLTAKTVRYYISVRAYSAAGSFTEAFSNGIRVGYEENIKPGDISYKPFQHSNNSIEVGWSEFISDYGIRHYEVAVSTGQPPAVNDTIDCRLYRSKFSNFDIVPLRNVDMNTYAWLTGLALGHGKEYYVTIVAEDESGSCISIGSGPITVDMTEPVPGRLLIDGRLNGKRYNFVGTLLAIDISWTEFTDIESGISAYQISLLKSGKCSVENEIQLVEEKLVTNVSAVTFYDLEQGAKYYVSLRAVNRAGLKTTVNSSAIFIDNTEPTQGTVKAGSNWLKATSVQSSVSSLNAILLLATDAESHRCPQQYEILSSNAMPQNWHHLLEEFSPECVAVRNQRLVLTVHTDDHVLSQIVKGGIRSEHFHLRDGSYSFTLTALRGNQTVSSVSIARTRMAVPMNFSEDTADIKGFNASSVLNSTDETGGQTPTHTEDYYGTGFIIPGYHLDEENERWFVLFWATDRFSSRQEWIELDFDPTRTEVKYSLKVEKFNVSEVVTRSVSFFINGVEVASANSLIFGETASVFAFGYNKNNYIPEVADIFKPFYAEMVITSILLPVKEDLLCKYGSSFFDGESGIREIWAGVSDSVNETGNIASYELQREFCLPCRDGCIAECDLNCTMDMTGPLNILHLALSDLSLTPSSNVSTEVSRNISSGNDMDVLNAYSYYVNVKVVNFAGLEVEASSAAVIVDDTPPHFNQLDCVDPAHSMDEPAFYQGTNISVGAFWDCKDDISQITGYTLHIGTTDRANDVLEDRDIGLKTTVHIEDLEGRLKDKTTYYITVTAHNEAGLQESRSCNITVDMDSPKTDAATSSEMFSVPEDDSPPHVSFSDRSDRVGVQWDDTEDDTEFFEWDIGTDEVSADIFPRVKIGTRTSRKAAVVGGQLWLDGININTTVKEYVLKNWTDETIAEAKAHGSFFQFEPGRCIHVNLFAVSRSHLSSKIPVRPICIKRKPDVLVNFGNEKSQLIVKTGGRLKKVSSKVRDIDFSVKFRGISGGFVVGMLNTIDLEGLYGSAASADYRPYIVSPKTQTDTSRLLRKRIRQFTDTSFFISPVSHPKLMDWVEVSLKFNHSESKSKPALVYWNQDTNEWYHIEEDCVQEESINYSTNTYTAKVCLPHNETNGKERRSLIMTTEVTGPRQFSLVFISDEIIQTPPQVDTHSLTYTEDSVSTELRDILYHDGENDKVKFRLLTPPVHGYSNITADGQLYYHPNKDYAGEDSVEVELTEVSLPPGQVPHPVRATIKIFVTEVNDAPELMFTRNSETYTAARRQSFILPVESNNTDYFVGTFLASDIDIADRLIEKTYTTDSNQAIFTLKKLPDSTTKQLLDKMKPGSTANTVAGFELSLTVSKDFYGVLEYGLMVQDQSDHWSLPVNVKVAVLYNPCVYGACESSPIHRLSCTDFKRATTFEFHRCRCLPGYEGEWCQIETNECRPNPCDLMFDCEDLVAGYRCNINIAKLMAILVCVSMALGLVIFALYRRKMYYTWFLHPKSLIRRKCMSQPTNLEKPDVIAINFASSRR